jgi:hypothetical protein
MTLPTLDGDVRQMCLRNVFVVKFRQVKINVTNRAAVAARGGEPGRQKGSIGHTVAAEERVPQMIFSSLVTRKTAAAHRTLVRDSERSDV